MKKRIWEDFDIHFLHGDFNTKGRTDTVSNERCPCSPDRITRTTILFNLFRWVIINVARITRWVYIDHEFGINQSLVIFRDTGSVLWLFYSISVSFYDVLCLKMSNESFNSKSEEWWNEELKSSMKLKLIEANKPVSFTHKTFDFSSYLSTFQLDLVDFGRK